MLGGRGGRMQQLKPWCKISVNGEPRSTGGVYLSQPAGYRPYAGEPDPKITGGAVNK